MKNKVFAVQLSPAMTEKLAKGCQLSGHFRTESLASKLQLRRTLMKRSVVSTTLMIVSVAAIWAAMAVPAVAQLIPGVGSCNDLQRE